MGRSLAAFIASYNPKKLILAVRNRAKGEATLEFIKSRNGHSNNVEVWEMDLADLKSVKSFAEKFIKEVGELHLLFNNAGTLIDRNLFFIYNETKLFYYILSH